ncbi:hypothetical protein ACFL2V_00825 [Pseudomonadota bacterium]
MNVDQSQCDKLALKEGKTTPRSASNFAGDSRINATDPPSPYSH